MAHSILVVDDEQSIVDILKIHLEAAGYTVDAAYDGEEALDKAKDGTYSLIILDLTLPKRDGQSVCVELKLDPKTEKTPILMLTGRLETSEKAIAQKVGADAYLTKPFEAKEVLSVVKQLLS